MFNLNIDDFAKTFGIPEGDLPDECKSMISTFDFRYEIPSLHEQNNLVLQTLKALDGDSLLPVGSHRREIWQKGWSENLSEFVESDHDLAALLPKYYGSHQYLRFRNQYIKPIDPLFQVNFTIVLKEWLFRLYLSDFPTVYELGCGTGLNLVQLAQMFPEMQLHGLDWVPESQKLLSEISDKYGWSIQGRQFDFFNPDHEIAISPNSAVLTVTALEQLGDKHEFLLEYLLKQCPALCINIEPIIELYDDDNLLDFLAIQYHRKRAYLENYLPTLRQLEQQNKIEIIRVQRSFFGGEFNESHSIIVWKPVLSGIN